jgi:hypothetical protein
VHSGDGKNPVDVIAAAFHADILLMRSSASATPRPLDGSIVVLRAER